jgi:hypothetical protein
MKTHEFIERAGDDRLVRLNIPVDAANERYHVVVHVEPAKLARPLAPEYLSDDFINKTAGKWVGDFPTDSEGDYETREPL